MCEEEPIMVSAKDREMLESFKGEGNDIQSPVTEAEE